MLGEYADFGRSKTASIAVLFIFRKREEAQSMTQIGFDLGKRESRQHS
jgi:hypothetical protein